MLYSSAWKRKHDLIPSAGGCSGIGFAAAQILARKGATVHVLDLNPPPAGEEHDLIKYHFCDVANWISLRNIFTEVGHVDIAVANAGVSQECDYFADTFDAEGNLEEPKYNVVRVNYIAVLNFVKLALSAFRKQKPGSSLVLTASATGYSPEQSLPVYSATKTGVSIASANSYCQH